MSDATKNTTGVIDAFKAIPRERHKEKTRSTLIGIAIALFGWVAKSQWPELPTMVAYGTTAFGFVMVSGDYFRLPLKLFVAAIRDIVNALKGRRTAEPPDESNEP